MVLFFNSLWDRGGMSVFLVVLRSSRAEWIEERASFMAERSWSLLEAGNVDVGGASLWHLWELLMLTV